MIAVAPNDTLLEKPVNLQEVGRGGELFVFADADSGMSGFRGYIARLPSTMARFPRCCTWCRCSVSRTTSPWSRGH